MATGVGMGFDLEGLDKAIKNAEKGFDNLIKKGQKTQEAIVNNFRIMAEEGVGYFANKLNGISSAFENFGKSASKGMQDIASSSSYAVDKVNHLIDMVKSLSYSDYKGQSYSSGAVAKLTYEIEEAMKKLAQLQEKLNFYATGEGAKAIGFYDTSKIVEEANALQRYIELLQQERHELQQIANIKGFQAEQQAKIDAEWQRMEDERIGSIRESAKASSEAAKAESVAWKQSYEEAYRAYERLFDKADEREYAELFKTAEANLRQMQKAEAERYSDWLLQKKREEDEHKRVEDEKYKSTVEAIAKQNVAYAEIEKRKQQNQQVRDNAVQARANYESTIRMYEKMYDAIDAKEKEKERRYLETQKREEEAAAHKAKSVIDQANRELEAYRNAYKQRQQMYEQLWREMERKENQTFAGAIAFSNSAKTLEEERQAVKNLEAARAKLDKTDVNYQKDLNELNSRIKQHNKNIQEATAGAKDLQEKHRGLMDTSGQLARAMAAVFSVSAIKGYVNKLMQIRGEFEMQQRSLQVLLQDKDEANALWDKTVALAVKSPFTTKQLVTYTKQLAAYRVESEKLYETNKMLADVSAGLGVDMNRLILAFGQVKAANFLRGTELRQFSEAGVNMLDELAKRFTALEGRAVSVGEVFERVSKRMVSFADVEAVFKTITSEGGTFYQMQEKQSETLKGMMLNLKDSYELMLNDIGKNNEGMLKGFVSFMKIFVDGWREAAVVIKTAGTAMLFYFAASKIAKIGSAFSGLWAAMAANPVGAIAAGVGVLIGLFVSLYQHTNKLNEALLEVEKNVGESLEESIELYRKLTDTINDSTKSLDERNKAYEELKTKFKDILPDQLTELKYIESLAFNYKAAEDAMFSYYNAKAKQQKKDKIEALYEADFNTDESDLIKALRERITERKDIAEIDKTYLLSGLSGAVNKAIESIKSGKIKNDFDSLKKEIEKNLEIFSGKNIDIMARGYGEDYFDVLSIDKNLKELVATATKYKDSMAVISGMPYETYSQGVAFEAMQEFDKGMDTATKYFKDLVALRQKIADNKIDLTTPDTELNEEQLSKRMWYLNSIQNIYNALVKDVPQYANKIKELDKTLLDSAKKGAYEYKLALSGIENELFNMFAENAKSLSSADDGAKAMLYNFAENIKATADSKLATPLMEAITSAFNKAINDKDLSQKGKDLLAKLLPDEKQSTGDVRKLVEALLTQYRDEVKKWENSKLAGGEQLPLIQYINQFGDKKFKSAMGMFLGSDEEFNELQQKVIPVLEHIDRLLGGDPSKGKNGRSRDLVDERLRVIKEIYKAYKELNKTFDKTISKTGAMEKFGDAFYSAFGKTPEQMGYNLFTAQGVVDAYNKFISTLSKADDITKGNLAKGEFAMELQVEMQQNKDKDFQDEIERMFSGYELSLELEKLNIPRELVESLFDVDTFDLSDIRAKLEQELYRLQVAGGYEDQIKKIQEFLKKVSKMEQDEQEERLKEYIEFARGTLNERVKIKLEELSKIKKIEKAFKVESTDTDEEKRKKKELETAAKERARKEADAAIQKLDWEDFKSSDTFNIIFDDLEHASDEVLKNIIQQLKDFKNQWKDMPFDQMRQVVDLLQKAEGALGDDGNPFARAKRLKEAIKEDGRSKEQAQLDVYNAEEQKKAAEAALANYEIFKKVDEKSYDSASMSVKQQKEYVEWQKLSVKEQKDLVEEMQDEVSYQDDVIQKGKKQLNNIQALKAAYDEQANIIKEINGLAQSLYSSFKDIYEALGGDGDSINMIFADMAMAMLDGVVQATTMWLQFQALKSVVAEFGITLNSALGVIGLAVQAISLLAMAFTAFSKAHDKKKERQIQAEIKLVERLQKIYEDLGETIKNVYDIDTLNEATRLSKENLIAQINATERMIAAEEGKKKTDKSRIEDWKAEIEDYKKAIQELEETRLQEVGAFASDENKKSGAEAFLDAWMEAYKQTGDGLSGLNEQFDEFFEDMVKKQMLQRGANKFLEPFFKQFDSAIDKWSTGGITDRGMLDEIDEAQEYYLPQLNKFLTSLAETLGVSEEIAGSTAELGGLSAGISGITENQADILAAYWSSVRLYTADTNAKVTELATKLFSDDTTANPMLSQLKAILAQTTAIRDLFDSVVGHGNGGTHSGAYLKVAVG